MKSQTNIAKPSMNIDHLVNVLRRLNEDESDQQAREDALDLVKVISPIDLSLAEQQLIQEGTKPEELRHLCTIHMEVLQDELERLKASVDIGHPLYTLIEEHDEILKILHEIDSTNNLLQTMNGFDPEVQEFNMMQELAEKLISAEKHHLREENVLFPRLEEKGVTGPPRIMRIEHDDLRMKKKKLKKIADNTANINFNEFQRDLNEVVQYIVFNLRDHIFKENHILYPSAFDVLQESSIWQEIKHECDAIGYCSFTPQHDSH